MKLLVEMTEYDFEIYRLINRLVQKLKRSTPGATEERILDLLRETVGQLLNGKGKPQKPKEPSRKA